MKYPVAPTLAGQGFTLTIIARALKISRSGFYEWVERQNDRLTVTASPARFGGGDP